MKILFPLLVAILSWQTSNAQHFIGEIKFARFFTKNTSDTLLLFVDTNIVLLKFGEKATHSSPYEIHLLDVNKRFLFFKQDSSWIWLQAITTVNQNILTGNPHLISKEKFLGIDCEVYGLNREYPNNYKSLSETNKVWISKEYFVKDNDDFTAYDFTFFNKTNSIILKRETITLSTVPGEDSENIYSGMAAISIIPKLPKEYYTILDAFYKWYNK